LLANGYDVHEVKRRSSSFNTGRIGHLYQYPHDTNVHLQLHYGDMTDATHLIRSMQESRPNEIYNFTAQSQVQVSFETPEYTANTDAIEPLRLLEAQRVLDWRHRPTFPEMVTEMVVADLETVKPETDRRIGATDALPLSIGGES
jgi:GDPmannose 4,6-dehydratase